MENDIVKKLTGKNPQDFEFAAAHIINDSDIEAFSALVDKSEFLFDFIKENVKKRLANAISAQNYKNLLSFLKIYSHDYEDAIVSNLVKFADEDLTDEMLERLENGGDEEKTYAAKYFSKINDTLALDLLQKYAYSEFDALSLNCAEALAALGDRKVFDEAIAKLKSTDEFEKMSAVRFLVAYKDESALSELFAVIKTSTLKENIASEIPYLKPFLELLETNYKDDAILSVNYILESLGEVVSISQIFDFQLYEVLEKLIANQNSEKDSKSATVLLSAKLKFEQLTENDEYIFDEDKVVKEEVYGIKELLQAQSPEFWSEQANLFVNELNENSSFVFAALELVSDLNKAEAFENLKVLLGSQNQTIILKTVEVIKSLNKLSEIDKNTVLNKISDENIKLIIQSIFN